MGSRFVVLGVFKRLLSMLITNNKIIIVVNKLISKYIYFGIHPRV